MDIWPGEPFPQGATFDGDGVNFSVYSEIADRIEVCLFDPAGAETRYVLPEITGFSHHGYVPGAEPGQAYGYRVHGPWRPDEGFRCNASKLLIDPYAKSIVGELHWGPEVFGHNQEYPVQPDYRDSAPNMPKSVVTDPAFDWEDDRPPGHALHDTVIYEAHVRGLTMAHPDVPEGLRGTYLGVATAPVLEHLLDLGVTAIELLPVHHFVSEHSLIKAGLTNYWGYNSIGYLAPHAPYATATGDPVAEFKQMVKVLHGAGIEVILDVVYNHTAEGNHLGPTLSLKGFDNPTYYRLSPQNRGYYQDFTGTGNSLNMRHPQTLKLMMDSLRYWVLDMHVDGFRFDLASALARELYAVDRLSSFFDLMHQDPVISTVKLIAEPWDVGEGGYQVGNFPPQWSEWNGRYRDDVRDYWRGDDAAMADFAYRLTGSSDLYAWSGRRPSASINFVTAHDGFTLSDLVAYDHKHNEANGEDNRDGESHNRSWNSGAEGPTDDASVNHVRDVRRRSIMTTLLFSQGVPMLLAGDEIGRTQHGNNNAYCQDSELSWIDWAGADQEFLAFTRRIVQLRKDHRIFRRRRWFDGRPIHGDMVEDIGWYTPDGNAMSDEDWDVGYARSLMMFLNGQAIPTVGPRGEKYTDDSFLMMFNASPEPMTFVIPEGLGGEKWIVELDTATALTRDTQVCSNNKWEVEPWALVMMRRIDSEPEGSQP